MFAGAGESPMERDEFYEKLKRFEPRDYDLIDRAYRFAELAHADQKRKSGEPYMMHPREVAGILADLRMDAPTLAAGLLHDVLEDCRSISHVDLEREFGAEVTKLVDGVTKMDQLPTDPAINAPKGMKTSAANREAEYLRKTFLAMGNDIRVILIKLADRLHNMGTLEHLAPEKQQRMARETKEIFAPVANRLGIWQIKWQLEDLCFKYLEPDKYEEIKALIAEQNDEREDYLTRVTAKLRAALDGAGILNPQISGRPKQIYSIYRKMTRKNVSFDKIYDARALRVIVADNPTCYQVLGIIHAMWHPVRGEFDDYIANPKDNFYQSLHTAVVDDEGQTLEVQIRTPQMHEDAEYGVAAHWRYKEGAGRDEQFERRLVSLRRLMELVEDNDVSGDAEEYVEAMKSDVLEEERIYVFTPKGRPIDLPATATPIDFAYAVHTEVGHRCRGARVNGTLVNLDHPLKSGDKVEILTAARGGPSLDWLIPNLGYTVTTRARGKIRGWFRKQSREQNILHGREAVDREIKKLGLDDLSIEGIAKLFNMRPDHSLSLVGCIAGLFNLQTDDLLAQVGSGEITGPQIMMRVQEEERRRDREKKALSNNAPPINTPQPARVDASMGIDVLGSSGLLINLARCCSPTRGDKIIGFITRGKGVTVHRADCPNVINTAEMERFIKVNWGQAASAGNGMGDVKASYYPVQVMVLAFDREGLMRDIGGVAADLQINISNVNVNTGHNMARFMVTLQVENTAQLADVMAHIEKLPNVIEVVRRAG